MAEPEACGSSETREFLPGFPTVNDYTQYLLSAVLQATKSSNELPAEGDDFDYYSSFQGFQDVMAIEGRRCLHLMQSLMKHQNVRGNIAHSKQGVDFEEKLDILIDSNDQLLERVGNWLDEVSGLKKKENPLIIATATPKQSATASWNKKSPGSQGSSSSSYRLLAARYTQRPQLKFKDKVNNSNQSFVPIIKYKPHALQSLQESLRLPENVCPDDISNPDFIYPHPYRYEIDNLKLDQHQLTATEPMNPLPLNETPLSRISTKEDLDKLVEQLKLEKEIAVDLEHHNYRTYLGITCLIQISTRKQDFLIDALELRSDLHVLNEIFADPKIVKVFHGADMDIDWLQRDFGLYVVNMFDTGQASRVLNFSRFSLSHLLQQFCDVEANKQYQLADWRIRPLPTELEQYAREDTHYLLYIYDRLKNQLIESGNDQKNLLMSVLQRSSQMCAKVYRKPVFQEDDYLDLFRKSKKVFNSQQLQALKALYAWRDSVARMEDESVGYVLPNHMLLQIAEVLPRERQGVFACCNPIPPLVRQYLVEIHSIVMEAKQTPLFKVEEPSNPKLPSSFQHPKYDVNSLLHCPHDLSHQDQTNVLKESMDTSPDPKLIAGQSSLFLDSKRGRNLTVVVKDSPILTAFDYSTRMKQQQMTSAQKKAAKIKALFTSPFEMFFLPENLESSNVQGHINLDKQQDRFWLLRGSAVKRKETEEKSDSSEAPSEPAAKRPKGELPTDNDHAETPLRFQMPSKKKIKLKLKNQVAENTAETTIKTEVSVDKMEPKRKKKKKKIVNDNAEEDETGFVPYDYIQAKEKLVQASNDKPVVYFDPLKEMSRKGKNVSRPNFGGKKGKKSYTFGKGEKKDKTQWPKF